MKKSLAVIAIFAAGVFVGQVVPVSASDSGREIVQELRELRSEITSIRRALEKGLTR